jgi:hypothetical protein
MSYILIIKNNPTAAGTDGTVVSSDGSNSVPIQSGIINATTTPESSPIKLAIRTNVINSVNYTTSAVTKLFPGPQTTIAVATTVGATSITVTDSSQFAAAESIVIGTETNTIKSISGNVILLSTELTNAHSVGDIFAIVNYDKIALALDNAGSPGTWAAYGASIAIPAGVVSTNTIFWAKAKAVSTDSPINYTMTKICYECDSIIQAA